MNPLRTSILLAGLLLLALPALAADTYQVTIDRNSPAIVSTGLILEEGDHILVQAQGAIRLVPDRDFLDGWFGPAGVGSMQSPDQIAGKQPIRRIVREVQ